MSINKTVTDWIRQDITPRLVEAATTIERLEAENAALRAELDAELTESTASMIALQYVKEDYEELRAENAALRARLDGAPPR